MNKVISFLKEARELKWKDLKNKEKKFLIVMFIGIFLLILYPLIKASIYAALLDYNSQLTNYFNFGEKRIYYPNSLYKIALTKTPKTAVKLNLYMFIYVLVVITLSMMIGLPIQWVKKNTDYGSARWAEWDDLRHDGFFHATSYSKAFGMNLLEKEGVIVGEFNGRLLKDNNKTHILLSAPTRTGKGVSIIIPTLLEWKDSVFCLDIKGENYQLTKGWREKGLGNNIFRFAPMDRNSCSFNPVLEIRYLTDKEIDDTKTIANLLVISEGGTSDPFWEQSGADFMVTLILWSLYKNKGKGSLSEAVKFITDPRSPLINRLNDILNTPILDINDIEDQKIIKKLLEIYTARDDQEEIKKGFHPFIKRGAADILNAGEKTLQSIVKTAKSKLSIFESPTVEKNTSSSDFKISDLMHGENPVTVYVVIPPANIKDLAPLLRILAIQCVSILTAEMNFTAKVVPKKHRLLMLMDEFPSIGKLDVLETGIGFVAGYGIKLMLVVQSLDQLNKIYTKDNMFLSNCQTQIFYTANELQTCEYISKTLDTQTIRERDTNHKGLFPKYRYFGRDLMKPGEFRNFPLDKILLIVGGKSGPIKSKKILFFIDPRFKDKINFNGDVSKLSPHMRKEYEEQQKIVKGGK